MGVIDLLFIAVGLAMDAAAVSLAAATAGYAADSGAVFRLSFHFGLFQALMPVLGWVLGTTLAGHLSSIDDWVAFGLLTFVGARMIRSGFKRADSRPKTDPSRGLTMVMLSIATSMDALVVGLSLAMLGANILYSSVTIGVVTASLCLGAIGLGNRINLKSGRWMEMTGGAILVAMGLRIILARFL